MGLPLLNGFIGEFTILQGAFARELLVGVLRLRPGIVLGAAYLLWLYQRVFFGELTNPANAKLPDLTLREQLDARAARRPRALDRPLPEAVLRRPPRRPSENIVRAVGGATSTPPAIALPAAPRRRRPGRRSPAAAAAAVTFHARPTGSCSRRSSS